MTWRRISLFALFAILLFDVWVRCHTIGPTINERFGLRLYPVISGEAEPLDCDEAIYAYIGKRLHHGAVMYRDVTENKPPGGYWLYEATVAIAGATETSIRLMPIPFVLATIVLVWWIGGKAAGPVAANVGAFIYALMSTDPYLYGNGANMEHFINLFSTAGLAFVISAWPAKDRRKLFAAGVCVGAACLVKQIAVAPLLVYCVALAIPSPRTVRAKITDIAALVAGFVMIIAAAALWMTIQGAGQAAFDDIFRYGRALATDTPRDPKEKPFYLRWLTGNTDPEGRLPWPFGVTKGRAWWAAGSWPLWAVSVPCFLWLAVGKKDVVRRIIAGWIAVALVQVAAPGLFWQHYYLLPLPGVAAGVAISLADAFAAKKSAMIEYRIAGLFIISSIVASAVILCHDYLLVAPERLTIDYKGGAQWVALRDIGRAIGRRTHPWKSPRLFVWGIQSPLYIYSGLDGVTRQVFTDPLIVAFAETGHPLIGPRLDRTLRELKEQPPDLILIGERPFPHLMEFVKSRYVLAPLAIQGHDITRGRLWVRQDQLGAWHAANK